MVAYILGRTWNDVFAQRFVQDEPLVDRMTRDNHHQSGQILRVDDEVLLLQDLSKVSRQQASTLQKRPLSLEEKEKYEMYI